MGRWWPLLLVGGGLLWLGGFWLPILAGPGTLLAVVGLVLAIVHRGRVADD